MLVELGNGEALLLSRRVPGEIDPALGLIVELLERPGEDRIDGDALARHEDADDAIARHRPTITFLCSPNNPTGRIYTLDELAQLAEVLRQASARTRRCAAPPSART